ncbi:hypothetical protein SYJ56_23155 [Algoriphagus sp. D3-2-R+10]|uniref:hypothetical protein n=1 Tax=Algoriphagus aurantiacus TaxID=3103948 RepID=UPI002B3D2DFD|nr:hypothetical protein [Algoriphagus sp. D3-2-R+10]MEB2778228.1 hypothetical protein [Algoriphagus sp. D3-2-R+10]
MIKRIKRATKKYGNLIFILIGVLFILLGLTLQMRGIESFEAYNYLIHRTQNTSTSISYITGIFIILMAFKKDWIFKKKQRQRMEQARIVKLKPDNIIKKASGKNKKKEKVIKLENVTILKINKE